MLPDISVLASVLAWFVSGPGAGLAAYALMEKIPAFSELSSELKRYASIALASLIAMAAYSGAVGLKYTVAPASPQGWLEALFAISFVASGLSQVIHGRVKLRAPPAAK